MLQDPFVTYPHRVMALSSKETSRLGIPYLGIIVYNLIRTVVSKKVDK